MEGVCQSSEQESGAEVDAGHTHVTPQLFSYMSLSLNGSKNMRRTFTCCASAPCLLMSSVSVCRRMKARVVLLVFVHQGPLLLCAASARLCFFSERLSGFTLPS